ncbi:MAG: DHHW family protein [Paraclostridium sp.]
MKKFIVVFFILFIFVVPVITLITPDKKFSEAENKILQKLPKFNFDNIVSTKFMSDFDKYASDQFPLRVDFIKLKNIYSYIVGQREFREIYISEDNRLLEKFVFDKDIVDSNVMDISSISNNLDNKYNIKSTFMIIPTSIAFYEDSLKSYMTTDSQVDALNYISSKYLNSSNGSSFYTPFEVLNSNKSDYIYFNTDHHWTQLGAKLAYEDLYKTIVNDNPNPVTHDFYGTYYSKAILDFIKPDTIYAYENFNNFSIHMDFSYNYPTLYDISKLEGKNKYQYFLHGDPAIGTIVGNVNLDKEILIFKDSFAHSFIPFLTSNYSKIHFVDPRYYNLDLDKYIKENNNISEVLFMHNISSINTSELYSKIVK